tara:strand:- start:5842 stop:6519 length:678 start_codon:yes stop_codon:yes gene_type:complete
MEEKAFVMILGGRAGLKIASNIFEYNLHPDFWTGVNTEEFWGCTSLQPIAVDLTIDSASSLEKELDDVAGVLLSSGSDGSYFIGVGDNKIRQSIHERMRAKLGGDEKLLNAVHKNATVDGNISGRGNLVMPGSVINICAKVGDCTIINTNSTVEHDCEIGDYAQLGPGATLAGYVDVKTRASIWSNATISPGLQIGADAAVGAGAVLIKNAPPETTWVGVPAKQI